MFVKHAKLHCIGLQHFNMSTTVIQPRLIKFAYLSKNKKFDTCNVYQHITCTIIPMPTISSMLKANNNHYTNIKFE